jgi:hypothetical protein
LFESLKIENQHKNRFLSHKHLNESAIVYRKEDINSSAKDIPDT